MEFIDNSWGLLFVGFFAKLSSEAPLNLGFKIFLSWPQRLYNRALKSKSLWLNVAYDTHHRAAKEAKKAKQASKKTAMAAAKVTGVLGFLQ